jgi:hypothetical protein
MRENCVRLAAIASATGFCAPLMLLFIALLLRVFGRTDGLRITWVGDTMYIHGPKAPPSAAARARATTRHARTPSTRRPDSAHAPADTPSRSTRRPVDRYPKSA